MKQRILIIEDNFTIHTVVFTKNGKVHIKSGTFSSICHDTKSLTTIRQKSQ